MKNLIIFTSICIIIAINSYKSLDIIKNRINEESNYSNDFINILKIKIHILHMLLMYAILFLITYILLIVIESFIYENIRIIIKFIVINIFDIIMLSIFMYYKIYIGLFFVQEHIPLFIMNSYMMIYI